MRSIGKALTTLAVGWALAATAANAQVNYSVPNTAARTRRSAANNDVRPGFLWGRVRDVNNQPAAMAPVALARVVNGKAERQPLVKTLTDGRGAYFLDIRNLQPGDYMEIVNPGPSMAGGNLGGQKLVHVDNPQAGIHQDDWVLSQTPPSGPNGQPG